MRILAVNINSPAVERARQQADRLLSTEFDLLVLTEVKSNAGCAHIVKALSSAGCSIAGWSEQAFQGFSTVIASRVPSTPEGAGPQRIQRLAALTSPTPIKVIAAYGPSTDPFGRNTAEKVTQKEDWLREFIAELVPLATAEDPYIIIGDLNFVDDRKAPQYSGLYTFERDAYSSLTNAGWRDLLRESPDYSWVSHQGHGFRFDHALTNAAAIPLVKSAVYDHTWREGAPRLTDHSAVVLDLRIDVVPRVMQSSPAPQATLF